MRIDDAPAAGGNLPGKPPAIPQKKLRIYIASSWSNQHAVEMLTESLRNRGHEVVSFVEKAVCDEGRSNIAFDVEAWIASEDGKEKFAYDIDGATNSNLVIYIGPSGTDAWAEVGAAYGAGVVIFGLWAKGEKAGLMRRMVRWFNLYSDLLTAVDAYAAEVRVEISKLNKITSYYDCSRHDTSGLPPNFFYCKETGEMFNPANGIPKSCPLPDSTLIKKCSQCLIAEVKKKPAPTPKSSVRYTVEDMEGNWLRFYTYLKNLASNAIARAAEKL